MLISILESLDHILSSKVLLLTRVEGLSRGEFRLYSTFGEGPNRVDPKSLTPSHYVVNVFLSIVCCYVHQLNMRLQ